MTFKLGLTGLAIKKILSACQYVAVDVSQSIVSKCLLQLGIWIFVQMWNSSFVHLLFKVADLFDLWKSVRLVRWHFIPRCIVEDEQ